jgi:hypothetical protein
MASSNIAAVAAASYTVLWFEPALRPAF